MAKTNRNPAGVPAKTGGAAATPQHPADVMRHWVVLQGYGATVVHQAGPPDLTVQPGERRKVVMAAFADAQRAQDAADRVNNHPITGGLKGVR